MAVWLQGAVSEKLLTADEKYKKARQYYRISTMKSDRFSNGGGGVFALMFGYDIVIQPMESSWLGIRYKGKDLPFEKSGHFYDKDPAGFRQLQEEERLYFHKAERVWHNHDGRFQREAVIPCLLGKTVPVANRDGVTAQKQHRQR